MVANEISRLPHGKSFYAFPLWCFESLHGESMPEPSLGRFSIMNKTTIKKTNKFNNDNLFAFCRLKRQISFSKKSLLVSILGGLGWSRYKMSNSGYPELHCHLKRVWHWAQVEQQKGEENQPSQEWSLLASSSRHAGQNEQFLSVVVKSLSHVQLFVTPMDCSTSGFPILYYLPEFAPIHVHWDRDAIWPSCPLSPPSPAFNISQHQGLFRWVGFSPSSGQSTGVSASDQNFPGSLEGSNWAPGAPSSQHSKISERMTLTKQP